MVEIYCIYYRQSINNKIIAGNLQVLDETRPKPHQVSLYDAIFSTHVSALVRKQIRQFVGMSCSWFGYTRFLLHTGSASVGELVVVHGMVPFSVEPSAPMDVAQEVCVPEKNKTLKWSHLNFNVHKWVRDWMFIVFSKDFAHNCLRSKFFVLTWVNTFVTLG